MVETAAKVGEEIHEVTLTVGSHLRILSSGIAAAVASIQCAHKKAKHGQRELMDAMNFAKSVTQQAQRHVKYNNQTPTVQHLGVAQKLRRRLNDAEEMLHDICDNIMSLFGVHHICKLTLAAASGGSGNTTSLDAVLKKICALAGESMVGGRAEELRMACEGHIREGAAKLQQHAEKFVQDAARHTMDMIGIGSGKANELLGEARNIASFALRGAKQMLDGEKWRCREQAGWFTLRLQAKLREAGDQKPRSMSAIEDDVQQMVVRRRALEPSKGVQALFKNPEVAEQVQRALEVKWEDEKDRVERELKECQKELDVLLEEYQIALKDEAVNGGVRSQPTNAGSEKMTKSPDNGGGALAVPVPVGMTTTPLAPPSLSDANDPENQLEKKYQQAASVFPTCALIDSNDPVNKQMNAYETTSASSSNTVLRPPPPPRNRTSLEIKAEYDVKKDELKNKLGNCSDVSSQLGVVLDFLAGMQNTLFKLDAKLDAILDQLQNVASDVNLLVGRTFEEAVKYRCTKADKHRKALKREVYVPLKCRRMRNLAATEPERYDLMEEVELFLASDQHSVLLVHGYAGSGKSTFADRLMNKLWKEYAEKKAKQEKDAGVLPLPLPVLCNLPALKSPLVNMVDDALRQEFGREGIKEALEFRTQAKKGDISPIFVLDGYDELRQEYIGQNLYDTNDMEEFGPDEATSQYPFSNPKLIILCRSELLATKRLHYFKWFCPLVSEDESQNDVVKARDHMMELQLSKFDAHETHIFFAARACKNLSLAFVHNFDLDFATLELPKSWWKLKETTVDVRTIQASTSLASSASKSSSSVEMDMAAAVESRRMLATGDATHFTTVVVTTVVQQQSGWGENSPLPLRLQKRLRALNKMFKSKETLEARRAHAKTRRLAFRASIAAKARRLAVPPSWYRKEEEKGGGEKKEKHTAKQKSTTKQMLLLQQQTLLQLLVSSSRGIPTFTNEATVKWKATSTKLFDSYRALHPCKETSLVYHLCSAVALLVAATPKNNDGAALFTAAREDVITFIKQLAHDEQNTVSWPAARFSIVFDELPELKGLASTPFMLRIATDILGNLAMRKTSANDIKGSLIALAKENYGADVLNSISGCKDIEATQALVDRVLEGKTAITAITAIDDKDKKKVGEIKRLVQDLTTRYVVEVLGTPTKEKHYYLLGETYCDVDLWIVTLPQRCSVNDLYADNLEGLDAKRQKYQNKLLASLEELPRHVTDLCWGWLKRNCVVEKEVLEELRQNFLPKLKEFYNIDGLPGSVFSTFRKVSRALNNWENTLPKTVLEQLAKSITGKLDSEREIQKSTKLIFMGETWIHSGNQWKLPKQSYPPSLKGLQIGTCSFFLCHCFWGAQLTSFFFLFFSQRFKELAQLHVSGVQRNRGYMPASN